MNKVVLVTGSSIGIGRATIIEFAKNNCNVVINYNSHKKEAEELEKYIKSNFNVETMVIKCDISNEIEVKIMIEKIINKFKNIDILINNAAIEVSSSFEEKTVNDFKKILNVNLIGTFLVSKYVSKYMLKQKKGKIINVASNNAINTNDPNTLEYDASKSGVISLTHNLSKYLAPYISVNAVAPGWVETKKIKELDKLLNEEFIKEESKKIYLKRFAKEEEIASLIYYLTTNDYINNEVIKIDGGTY